MGRVASKKITASADISLNGYLTKSSVLPGFMGIFGSGYWSVFYKSGSFKIPKAINKIRVRVVGAGGAGRANANGGAGGGYAHGVFNVIEGDSYSVTIGAGGVGPLTPIGGTSSFGNLISATGGGSSLDILVRPTPGIGIGGDFQAKGGTSANNGGGGAAGSQLGDGGSSMAEFTGGAGVGGNHTYSRGGGSAFGGSTLTTTAGMCYKGTTADEDIENLYLYNNVNIDPFDMYSRFPFDCFLGGGGYSGLYTGGVGKERAGGSGAGGEGGIEVDVGGTGTSQGGIGGHGGGGGAGYTISAQGSQSVGGKGGIGGGGGGAYSTSNNWSEGGSGLVVIEW